MADEPANSHAQTGMSVRARIMSMAACANAGRPTLPDRRSGARVYHQRVITPQAPRPGRRHRKHLKDRLRSRALLATAAAIGLALIAAITVPAVLGATRRPHGWKPAPTVTVSVPAPRPTVTVTVPRPGPTVTVTELKPGPTVTVRCRHPGRRCGGA